MATREPVGARRSVPQLGTRSPLQACGSTAGAHRPHLSPTSPGTSGSARDRPRCSSSLLGRACHSPGRRPPGTLAAGHHSTPQGHTHPLWGGTAHRQGSPAQRSKAHVGNAGPHRPTLALLWAMSSAPSPRGRGRRTHPALTAAGALRTLGPRSQPAGGGVAAGVLTGLGSGAGPRRDGSGLRADPGPPSRGPRGWLRGSEHADGRAPSSCTWGGPQSHCSPRSRNRFPHTGSPTSRSGSGALARQAVRGFSMKTSRSVRLQWLNILGNSVLGVQGGACQGVVGAPRQPTLRTAPGLTRCWPP